MRSKYQRISGNGLRIENVPLSRIAAQVGTPLYVYSQSDIEDQYRAYDKAFGSVPHVICFAVKANSNLAIGRVISRMGGGADIVSGGELKRALLSGFAPNKIIFSGVGKTKEELRMAIQKRIRLINVESPEELFALEQAARSLRRPAPFSLRVNPDVNAGGHPHISTGTPANKFGVHYKNIFPLYEWANKNPHLIARGIQSHIGSQITRVAPYRRALMVLLDLVKALRSVGVHLDIIDLGGGLGIDYNDDRPDSPRHLAQVLVPALRKTNATLFLEPGRSLVAQSGVLVTRVLYRKDAGHKHFVIVDAAMNDLARPALYDAFHEIVPITRRRGPQLHVDVVGPVCESGDYLARGRAMRLPEQGDLLAVLSAGAYGFVMSSQYNSRPRVSEVLVKGSRSHIIRRRETFSDLIKGEVIPKTLR
jgi:diaminopimelate decarboxylase